MNQRAVLLVVLAAVCLIPDAARAQSSPDTLAHVTYLAGDLVYVDAGRDQGLAEGMRLPVERAGLRIALLEVRHLASRRASCSVVEANEPPQMGDAVRIPRITGQPVKEHSAGKPEPQPSGAADESPGGGGLAAWGVRGRLGARFLTVNDRAGAGAGFSQPALDMRLVGNRLNGGPVSLQVDARARRTYRTRTNGDTDNDGRTRVYRLSASYQAPDSPLLITLGRQVSQDLASVSLFDGVLGEFAPGRWGLGVFAGTQPEASSWGFSTDIVETGAFARYRNASGAVLRWTVNLGAVASRQGGVLNREYVFLRGQMMSPRFFGYLAQELDLNRDWKGAAGEPLLTATSTYASLRYRLAKAVELDGGYDNRRNVRLYRDRDTPETEFDDSYRRGVRLGLTLRPGDRVSLSLGGRTTGGGSSGDTQSATVTGRILRLTPLTLDLTSRHTRYTGPLAEGWLHVVSAGAPLGRTRRAEIHLGRRDEIRHTGDETTAGTTWIGADLDVGLAAGWYLLLSTEFTRGLLEESDQVYTSLTYRF